eukprot:scaffold91_cov127-Cylindrotheca_fusiformis.AAC.19
MAPGFYDPQDQNEPPQEERLPANPDSDGTTKSGSLTEETKEINEILEDDDYLKESVPAIEKSDWDTVVVDTTVASSKSDAKDKGKMNIRDFLAKKHEDFDVDYVASLPSTQRKDWVEDAQRKRRMESRRDFMKVAYDSSNFSKSQLANFLKSSKLNKSIHEMASKVVENEGVFGTLTSDRTKRILFEKDSDEKLQKKTKEAQLKEYASQKLSILDACSDEDSEDIQWEDPKMDLSVASKPWAIVDDSDSGSENAKEGGFVRGDTRPDASGVVSTIKHEKRATNGEEISFKNGYEETVKAGSGGAQPSNRAGSGRTLAEDAKLAQELQDESLAIAVQDAEYEQDGRAEAGGFLAEIDSQLLTPLRSRGQDRVDDMAESGGLVRNSDAGMVLAKDASREGMKDVRGKAKKIGGCIDDVNASASADGTSGMGISAQETANSAIPAEPVRHSLVNDDSDDETEIDWEDGACGLGGEIGDGETINFKGTPPVSPVGIESTGTIGHPSISESGQARSQNSCDDKDDGSVGEKVTSQHSTSKNSTVHGDSSEEIGNNTEDIFIDIIDSWGSDSAKKAAVSNEVTEALTHAQDTASRPHLSLLACRTNWAGRAFRRAVAQHAEESGGVVPDAAKARAGNIESGLRSVKQSSMKGEESHRFSSSSTIVDGQSWKKAAPNRQEPSIGSPSKSHRNESPMEAIMAFERSLSKESRGQTQDIDASMDEMKEDIVKLLELFGIPYVQAPAEAEAQCVALEKRGLVDGIVTEDSDAFVFGGQVVYKNIFEDKKYVEVYNAKDAEAEMNLTRDGMVGLAMLMGGDYTEGIRGVGIVNGMEILQAFDVSDDINNLKEFRKWLDSFDPNDILKTLSGNMDTTKQGEFHRKHHTARSRWEAPKHFPDARVLAAYLNPVVDTSREKFSWGLPDLDSLMGFCSRNIGWAPEETSRIVKPVLDKLESGSMHQTRIDSFMKYEDGIKFAEVRSKRLRDVLDNISGKDKNDDLDTVKKQKCSKF